MIKDAELTAIYGARGSGKTTRTLLLLRDRPRVVVFDPTGEYAREHRFKAVAGPAALRRYVARHWTGRYRVAWTPEGSFVENLHGLATFLMACQRPYLEGASRDKITLVVEEMNLSFPATTLPGHLSGMAAMCNQGRHYGLDVIGVTQRPAQISTIFRGNAAETWIYPLAWADDRNPVLAMIGRQHGAALAALRPHDYLRYRMGAVEKGRNPPPKA